MKNQKEIIIIGVILIAGVFFFLNKSTPKTADTFKKKQECSQSYDLANQKIKDSGRVFPQESYTLNELFYSPKMNTCLYAYTIHTSNGEIYSIYDLFGGDIYGGSIADDFQKQRAELK